MSNILKLEFGMCDNSFNILVMSNILTFKFGMCDNFYQCFDCRTFGKSRMCSNKQTIRWTSIPSKENIGMETMV